MWNVNFDGKKNDKRILILNIEIWYPDGLLILIQIPGPADVSKTIFSLFNLIEVRYNSIFNLTILTFGFTFIFIFIGNFRYFIYKIDNVYS